MLWWFIFTDHSNFSRRHPFKPTNFMIEPTSLTFSSPIAEFIAICASWDHVTMKRPVIGSFIGQNLHKGQINWGKHEYSASTAKPPPSRSSLASIAKQIRISGALSAALWKCLYHADSNHTIFPPLNYDRHCGWCHHVYNLNSTSGFGRHCRDRLRGVASENMILKVPIPLTVPIMILIGCIND